MRKQLLAGALALGAIGLSSAAWAAPVKLAFALDESGSVSTNEFNFIQDGLANALSVLPTDGSYEITVVAFSAGLNSANTVVSPIVVNNAATLASLQTTIRDYSEGSGGTDIGTALTLLNDIHGDIGDIVGLVNVVTDGRSDAFQEEATALANNGWDSLNFEAVTSNADTDVLDDVAFPGTVQVLAAGQSLPNPLEDSFVITVDDFAGFEAAISAKVQRVIDVTDPTDPSPSAVPVPAALPLLLSGLGVFGIIGRRRRKHTS